VRAAKGVGGAGALYQRRAEPTTPRRTRRRGSSGHRPHSDTWDHAPLTSSTVTRRRRGSSATRNKSSRSSTGTWAPASPRGHVAVPALARGNGRRQACVPGAPAGHGRGRSVIPRRRSPFITAVECYLRWGSVPCGGAARSNRIRCGGGGGVAAGGALLVESWSTLDSQTPRWGL
jgi:hypothetical protein